MHNTQTPTLDQQVLIWRRDIDAAMFDRHAIACLHGRKSPGTLQNTWQHARALRRQMQDDTDRRRQIGRLRAHKGYQRLYTTG
jgi:hypothetical protein